VVEAALIAIFEIPIIPRKYIGTLAEPASVTEGPLDARSAQDHTRRIDIGIGEVGRRNSLWRNSASAAAVIVGHQSAWTGPATSRRASLHL